MEKIRVMLADDHAIIREGLKTMINLQHDMVVVGEAENGRAAWQQAKKIQPDVVVLDVSMPDVTGGQVTEWLRRDLPLIKVLALTIHEDKGYLRQLLSAGACGYALKRAAPEELIHALRTVAHGGIYVEPSLANRVVGGYLRSQSATGELRHGELSDREIDVLRLIAWGYSNKEIGNQLGISVRTVETYKTRLMEKLTFHSRSEIVRYALQQGWLKDV